MDQNEVRTRNDRNEGVPDWVKLELVVNNLVDVISLHGLDGDFIYLSPSVERLHGYSAEEIKRLGPFHAVHPEDLPIIQGVLDKIMNKQQVLKTQYRFIHKNGFPVWVESVSQCINGNDGEPEMISVVTRDITPSRMLEDALRRNEEKYRSLVQYLPTGVLLINTRGEILEVNQALLDILGSPGAEPTRLINMFEFENLVKAGVSDNLKQCIAEKKVVNGQTEYTSKWGKKGYLVYTAVPVFDSEGNVHQVICNVRDNTRIRRAEEKTQQQIDFLNVVINTMQEPFFVKDENHRWIMLNDAAIHMMGRSREELIGKTDHELYPKSQADIFWEKDDLVFRLGSNVNEEKITWSDGSERIIITNKQLYQEGNTGKKYIVGTIHDITEIRLSESRLLESEKKYHELFDNANDHIFTTDLNGTFTNANRAMLNKIGISIDQLSNYNIFSFCKPEVLQEAQAMTQQLMMNGSTPPFEIETIPKDGKAVVLEVQAKVMYQDGKPVGIQGIARDITEKKSASVKLEMMNRELQELNANKDKFYSIIAHDLKNPFNSLIGFSDLLLEEFDELSREEMRDYVGIIRNTAKNSLSLLENLLAWSRLQTGRMGYVPKGLNLATEVDAACTILFSLSYRKKIDILNTIDRNIHVLADQNMVSTILNNLLMNAIKFTPSGGKITIHAEAEPETEGAVRMVTIGVDDTGIGISKEDSGKLFSLTKPFTMPGTERESGTGLGLLLTKEMVEKHGGSLTFISEPGTGSTFTFTLPLFVP